MAERKRLVSRTEIAQLAGTSKQTVSQLCRGTLRPAMVRSLVDLDHPATVAYLARHGAAPPPRPEPKPRARRRIGDPLAAEPEPTPEPEPLPADELQLPVGVEGIDASIFGAMTLDRIAREYSTMAGLERVLGAAATVATIREKDDKHKKFEGSVVDRELVTVAVFGALERLARRLAKPVPKTIVRRAIGDARGGKPTEEIEAMACDLMGQELKATWDSIARTLRKA